MAGNKAGAVKLRRNDPDFFKKIGAIGGRKSRLGGFHARPEIAAKAGSLGGAMSRRTIPKEVFKHIKSMLLVGYTPKEVVKATGYSRATVYKVNRTKNYREYSLITKTRFAIVKDGGVVTPAKHEDPFTVPVLASKPSLFSRLFKRAG